ncbi:MAG: tRNA (adenosine(37)-N6)-threonylcarbamoyltransferase complex dimerization subunit type 1 TsaB [Acidobacteria bacterium]|nr:tRNA (adenosine(37)-N6)-threonylcarbamoyltransferase complex dimerization subunit type 1 TsaB [Acidobacteriota bacterium]
MLILALDTTSRAGSLAIVRDGELMHATAGDPSLTHGQRLPLDFMRVCDGAGVKLRDIELFAVAAGPGSFTGLRVGIAAIQGLAIALDRRVVPVSTLEAVAASAPSDDTRIAAWIDAQRGEVYAQLWTRLAAASLAGDGSSQRVVEVSAAISASPEAVIESWSKAGLLDSLTFRGDGAVRYAERIRAAAGVGAVIAADTVPLAPAIGRIADAEPGRAIVPHAIMPIYVRRPDAELARSRREGTA